MKDRSASWRVRVAPHGREHVRLFVQVAFFALKMGRSPARGSNLAINNGMR